jgi:hypothetical protein
MFSVVKLTFHCDENVPSVKSAYIIKIGCVIIRLCETFKIQY